MTLIYFSFTDMCFYHRSEPSSHKTPHRPQSTNNCRRCVTVCGYQKFTNEIILCATCYHQLPSNYMRKAYRFVNIHYATSNNLEHKFTHCSCCSYDITQITPHHKCYLCFQLASTTISLKKLYHEPR